MKFKFNDFAPEKVWVVEVANAYGSFYKVFESKKDALEDVMYSSSTLTSRKLIGRYDFAPDAQPRPKKKGRTR